MTASQGWLFAVAGYALLLAWPLSTVVLVWFGVRYVGTHRAKVVNRAVAGGDARPEHFWVIVPALNEEAVVANTVSAALGLHGPAGTLARVLVVDDGSDDRTPEVLAAIDHPRLHIMRRELPEARQGKGEALNAAYRHISMLTAQAGVSPERVVIGIIDGDGQGSENILIEVSRLMRDSNVGAVQVQVRIRNRNKILGAVQDLEFGAIVDACQNLRDVLDTVGLGGNGQFSRLSTLQSLGTAPWSSCLVEDMELGLRMHLDGVSIRYTSRSSVTQQAVVDVRRLTRQRTRWAQGNMQCARYLGTLFSSPRIARSALMEIMHYLLSPWANAIVTILLMIMFGSGALGLAIGHPVLFLPTWAALAESIVIWAVVTTIPGLIWAMVHKYKRGDEAMPRMMVAALAYPAFLVLGLAATYRALGRQASGRQGWAKTERLAEEPLAALPTAA
ncbi:MULTISPECIES: glycosyltransferase [Actinoplanes]|uniref:glycosyltransferase n=1 Tax=Actinoplanes TaxID=1865 RepID=UPI0005F2A594|nr:MULTISPECIES: glycosyltransferase [Actinoplanes]GLY05146.1 hypothetical protein Acsp01_55250 [Actinoplanes sp. NBRC 101535]